jgi:hypothetical protein
MIYDPEKFLLGQEEEEEKNEGLKRLEEFLSQVAERLRGKRIPVDNSCRINMEAFRGGKGYEDSKIDRHIRKVEKKYQGITLKQIENTKLKTLGEQFEVLKTAILNKLLGDSFIFVRASFYDDFFNQVDNIILDREGNIVCAFDEVASAQGGRYYEKINNVSLKNSGGGCSLEYGLRVEGEEVILGQIKNIPIFYLALTEEKITSLIKNFKTEETSEEEKNFLLFFIATLLNQIDELSRSRLEETLRNRLNQFNMVLEEIIEERGLENEIKEILTQLNQSARR